MAKSHSSRAKASRRPTHAGIGKRYKEQARLVQAAADKWQDRRIGLDRLLGDRVKFSGETSMRGSTKKYNESKPVILENVVIDGELMDHLWVTLGQEDWAKLAKRGGEVCRVYLVGEVIRYKSNGTIKIGMSNVELVKEIV